jgi:hypothetical protein
MSAFYHLWARTAPAGLIIIIVIAGAHNEELSVERLPGSLNYFGNSALGLMACAPPFPYYHNRPFFFQLIIILIAAHFDNFINESGRKKAH